MNLTDEFGSPRYKVRYSLRRLEEVIIEPPAQRAIMTDQAADFLDDYTELA